MRDVEITIETLQRLREVGVSIAIDDYGSAYSSLGALQALPIDAVKIGGRLVENAAHIAGDAAIAGAVIDVCRTLALRVGAEGVETRAQLEFLEGRGCEEAQGFLISRPLEEPELRNWWRMQEVENRIVGRQGDMWQAEG